MTTSDLVFSGGGRERPLTIVRPPRARRMRLSVDPRDGTVRLSLPPRAPLRPALAWAAEKRPWIETQLARLPGTQPIIPGMRFCLGGDDVGLDWSPSYRRSPERVGDRLRVGGPIDQLPARLLRYLKRMALDTLERETRDLAAAHGIMIGKVGVGDPRARWGSCASSGDIRYSWRLILAPAAVRQATVAHEVAHRVHMDHSAAFHAQVRVLFGRDPAPERRWLRAHGAALHGFGRDG